ncbi:MAG: ribose-phosphate diphosphokinase [Anaerolineae bacterium]
MTDVGCYGGVVIYSGTGSPDLASQIAENLELKLCEREVITFPNSNLFVRLGSSVRGQDAFIIQTTSAPTNDNLMELLIFIDTLKRASAGRVTAVVPYLGYARSDKKDQPRVPITARLVADMIQSAGADRYITLDLHSGQIQGFFSIPGDMITAFPLLADHMRKKDLQNAVVVAADLGFAKKARAFATELDLPVAFVEKRRIDMHTEALTVIGDVDGMDAIIVDDEVDTAGTMCDAATALIDAGARDIYSCFVHPILSADAADMLRQHSFKEIVTTNSVPIPLKKRLPNMTVISVSSLLAGVIKRVHAGRSVGEMFVPYHGYS